MGMPCDLEAVLGVARSRGLPVVEDAACAVGSQILWDGKGEPGQANAVSHGCPAARFRGVNILNVNARGKA